MKHGQRKRTRDIVTWLKKKRRVIRREELLAFLLDKPYPPDSTSHQQHLYFGSQQSGPLLSHHLHHHHHFSPPPPPPPPLPPHSTSSPHLHRPLSCIDDLNFSGAPVPMVSVPLSIPSSSPCLTTGHLPTPRSRWPLLGRDEQGLQNEGEVYSSSGSASGGREGLTGSNGRKRLNSNSSSGNFDFSTESPPLAKRMKI